MPAGSGKTQTALELIARLGYRALWITHTIDLLNQSYNRAKDNMENSKWKDRNRKSYNICYSANTIENRLI